MEQYVKNEREIDKNQVIEKFLRYKYVVQGRSKKTVSEYGLDLRTFFRYLAAIRNNLPTDEESFNEIAINNLGMDFVRSIETIDILEFMVFCTNERNNSTVARSRKLSSIRSFFKYLTAVEKSIEKNPANDIESPKKPKTLPKYLSLEESVALLQAVEDDKLSKTRERDYCILTLFLNCGMRLSELVGINISNVDREFRSLRVIGKGNKERIVYLNEACQDAMKKYWAVRGTEAGERVDPSMIKDKNAFFLSRLHTRISNKTVQWVAYKYFGLAGLDYKQYSVHKLRHTAATLMYQNGGVDVLTLKEILGHAQLNTTQIYTHASNKLMEEAMQKNPLSGKKAPQRATEAIKNNKNEEEDNG